uniref:Uncharacterized protein n=1 Tax=Arundo donax TaxID=35708 RepID=A0A0A8Z3K4_ARUDO
MFYRQIFLYFVSFLRLFLFNLITVFI